MKPGDRAVNRRAARAALGAAGLAILAGAVWAAGGSVGVAIAGPAARDAGHGPRGTAGPLGAALTRCEPIRVALQPTSAAPGAAAYMEMSMAPSPFGVAVAADGRYAYDVTIGVERLRRRPGRTYVAWAATPELDRLRKLGVLDEASGVVRARVQFNKFLVFVTAEASADLDRWEGPILLTGISPSGLMHTMRGHGIFEAHGVGC